MEEEFWDEEGEEEKEEDGGDSATEEEGGGEESDEDGNILSSHILISWRSRKKKMDSKFSIADWDCDTDLHIKENKKKSLNGALGTKINSAVKKLFVD